MPHPLRETMLCSQLCKGESSTVKRRKRKGVWSGAKVQMTVMAA